MSKIVKFKLNKAGVGELLKSEEVGSVCMEHANCVRNSAGEHYTAEARHYRERTGAAVYPSDPVGIRDNLQNNTLLRSLK